MKEKIDVKSFVEEYVEKRIENTKYQPDAIEHFIQEKLEIAPYIPFDDKRKIAKMIVETNMTEEYGIKKIDSVGQFISFVIAMIAAHTNLQFNAENPTGDYDLLSECGVLEHILAQFQKDYAECEVILKMVNADTLADNHLNFVIAEFLDGILDKLDGVGDTIKGVIEKIDLDKMMNLGLNENEIAKVKSLLNKFGK